MKESFNMVPAPFLIFGEGKISLLPSSIKAYGTKFMLVTGARSFVSSPHFDEMRDRVASAGLDFLHWRVSGEPTPGVVDNAVRASLSFKPDVIVAVGGGSVLDTGRAIAAMIPLNEPVKDYLEGVGTKAVHPGVKLPFIAIPTTAGTGSEAARNAVLSETGPNGYKRSLRHDNFVSDIAILDPALTLSCPPATTASSGMDAFTQLLESYLSPAGNHITDALALKGLQLVSTALSTAYKEGGNLSSRIDMALASYLSGITLTNAGLGLIHGFASSIGGFFPISHGIICSTLMAPVNKLTVRKLLSEKTSNDALKKYAVVGRIFSGEGAEKSSNYYIDSLLDIIQSMAMEMKIPALRQVGVTSTDFERIIKVTDNKNNPVTFSADEMREALEMAS